MRYIILTESQKDFILNYKLQWQHVLQSRHVDFIPILIKNNLWILPEELLLSQDFNELKHDLQLNGSLDNLEVREVLQDEFITENID